MKEKIKSLFLALRPWQVMLFSILGAIVITDLITALISLWIWHEIQPILILLGTINAFFVPLIILPVILRTLRKIVKLEEQDQINKKTISQLEEQKQMEASLRERESILEAITFAAEQLLKTPDWRININAILEHLGKTINASHAYLFEHEIDADKIEYSLLKYEWTAPGFPNDFDNPYYQTPNPIKLDENSTDYSLRQGHIIMGNVSTFHPADKERLLGLGAKAMLEVPLFVGGKWWGTFGFDDFEFEREWSNAEVGALKIAAGILGAAIQRQKADAAVQESERIYRQAIQAAGMVPYYRDYIKNEYTFVGDGIEKIVGYKPEEITPQLWLDIMKENIPLGEGDGLNVDDAVDRSRQGKMREWKSDMRVLAKNGEERWLSDSAIELFDDANISYASVGIMQDITNRKFTEVNLRKRESILEAITFSAEQFLKTPNWREKMDLVLERLGKEFNASHAYLFEKHPGASGELLNSLTYEWTAPGQNPDINNPDYQNVPVHETGYERYYQILDSGEPFVGSASSHTEAEKTLMLPSGIKALLEMRLVVDGNQWGTIGFDDMVNEREWTAMEVDVLKVATNVLGAAIKRQMDEAELQSELNQRKLLINELESKNEELERFTYTVSHDLKSPLVTINGFLGYLEQDAASGNVERLKKDTHRIQDAVNKMQRLLNELLELSRIGRMMNSPEIISFDDLVKETMNIVQGQLEARGVTVQIQPNLPAVYGDKPRLTEVLQNLLDNAAKYMGDQPSPRIEVGQHGDENGKTIFYVKDNGIGIASEYHDRIFGLFNKLDSKSEGTGVGLALVKRIIEIHGGRIWVESEVGQESTFFFTLSKPPELGSARVQ